MNDDSLGEEFCDVLSTSNMIPPSNGGTRGMSAYLKNEIQKQLDQSCIEISSWCGEILNESVSPDLLSSLRDGTVLCRVGKTLYPNNPPAQWIQSPKEYMDFNVNITIFADHCLSLGIEKGLVIDYTLFDDRDLPRLTTCLFEYVDFYNRTYMASHLPAMDGKQTTMDGKQTTSGIQTATNREETATDNKNTPLLLDMHAYTNLASAIENVASTNLNEGLIEPQNGKPPKKRYFCCCFLKGHSLLLHIIQHLQNL